MKKLLLAMVAIFIFVSCGNSTTDKNEITEKINTVYENQASIYDRTIDSSLFSEDLMRLMNRMVTVTQLDEERIKNSEYPTEKPVVLEGSVFSSLYDGYTSFEINKVKIDGDKAEAIVDFKFESPNNESWSDTVELINENGWKIDNVIFSDKYGSYTDLKQKLTVVAEEFVE